MTQRKYTSTDIEKALVNYTCAHSGFETKRDYISLSNISKTPQELVADYRKGYTTDEKGLLKCYKGYQMQIDLQVRLEEVFQKMGVDFSTDLDTLISELGTKDGLFKGHPDIMIDDKVPLDFKSVLMDEWIPENPTRISRKIKFQMNAYMLFAESGISFVLYESRESGIIKCYCLHADKSIQREIEKTIAQVRELLNTEKLQAA